MKRVKQKVQKSEKKRTSVQSPFRESKIKSEKKENARGKLFNE